MGYTIKLLECTWNIFDGDAWLMNVARRSTAERICQALNVLGSLELHGHKPEQIDDLFSELASLRKFATEARETLEMVRLANRALERILGEGGER